MRRLALLLGCVAALAQATAAAATTAPAPAVSPSASPSVSPSPSASPSASPSPSPRSSASPSPSSPASPTPTPTATPSPGPDPAVIASLQARLGADVAGALRKQQQMADALAADSAREQDLTDQISQSEDRLSALQDEIARLDSEILDKQGEIDVEKAEVATLVRALGRRPESVPLALARSRSLGEALRVGTDLLVAGRRAHALQQKLEGDLAALNDKREARQADADRETALRASLQVSLDDLEAMMGRQRDLAAALGDLLSQFQDTLSGLPDQPADISAKLTGLLEQQQQSLNAAAVTEAWSAAQVGAGRVQVLTQLPRTAGAPATGRLLLPIAGAVLTQRFGPTDLWFEPPLGTHPHFHAGIDLAAPEGTPVGAAGDGVVAAVGSTSGGYGNYVVIAHGADLMTLYGHLQIAIAKVGQAVRAGEVIGLEGSTGFSTGPHLHFEVRVGTGVADPMGYLDVGTPVAAGSAVGPGGRAAGRPDRVPAGQGVVEGQ